jgi:hypothetical protein
MISDVHPNVSFEKLSIIMIYFDVKETEFTLPTFLTLNDLPEYGVEFKWPCYQEYC